jgi:hypothetical protein
MNRSRRNDETTVRRKKSKETRLFLAILLVVGQGFPKMQHLTGTMAGKHAMRAFGLQRDQSDIPGTRAIRHRHAAARQPFECLELEHCRRFGLPENGCGRHGILPLPG